MKRRILNLIMLCIVAVGATGYGIKLRRDLYEASEPYRFTLDLNNAYWWGKNARAVGLVYLYHAVAVEHQSFSASVQLDYTPLRLCAVTAWQMYIERRFPDVTRIQPEFEFAAPMLWGNTIAALVASIFVFLNIRLWRRRYSERWGDSSDRSLRRGTMFRTQPLTPALSPDYEGEGASERPAPPPLPTHSGGERRGEGQGFQSTRDDKEKHPTYQSEEATPRRDLRYSEDPDRQTNPNYPKRDPLHGAWSAMLGALLLWFNPALLWNGYAWPQWDVWLVPFALGAIYFASIDCWFIAGAALAIGASLKGQLLLAAPIFILWPLFLLRLDAILRFIAGFALISAWTIFPFLLPSRRGLIWYTLMIGAMFMLAPYLLRWKLRGWMLATLAVLAVLLAWPWTSAAPWPMKLIPPAILATIALFRFLPQRLAPHTLALGAASAIFLLMPLYDASTAWFTQGFEYGPNRERYLHNVRVNNIPAMLERYLRWPNRAEQLVDAPFLGEVSAQAALAALYGAALVLCAAGAALQFKRRDPRFLIAMFLPWLLFFLTLTQMRGRYLVWAAAMSALLAGVSPGMTLLGLLVTAIALIQMVGNQFQLNGEHNIRGVSNTAAMDYFQWIQPYLQNLDPHLGWMLLLIAGVGLYFVVTPRREL